MTPADRAWICIGLGVLGWDICCEEGGTLSEAADRWMLHHPWMVRSVAFAIAGHVCNLYPQKLDAIHWLFVLSRRWRRP